MSIAFLFFTDKARSGLTLPIVKPAQNADNIYSHPFQWNQEYYPCPECLRSQDDALRQVVAAAERYAQVIDVVDEPETEGDSIDEFEELTSAATVYYDLLTTMEAVVKTGATVYDATEFLLQRILQSRVECVYNLAAMLLLSAAKQRSTSREVVKRFAEASGAFDQLLLMITGKEGLVSPYLSEEFARLASVLCIASAHEFSIAAHFKDAGKNLLNVMSLVNSTSFYYGAATAVAKTVAVPLQELWINYCSVKSNFFAGMLLYIASVEPGQNKGQSRRKKALVQLNLAAKEAASVLEGQREGAELEIKWLINRVTKFAKLYKTGRLDELAVEEVGGSQGEQAQQQLPLPPRRFPLLDEFYPFTIVAKMPVTRFVNVHPMDPSTLAADGLSNLTMPAPHQARSNPNKHRVAPSGAAAAPLFRRGSVISSATTPKVEISLMCEDLDLRLKEATICPSGSSTAYHFVEAVVSAGAPIGTTPHSAIEPVSCALIFVVDVNMTSQTMRTEARTSICTAIKKANLTKGDFIGLVHFDHVDSSPSVALVEASEGNIAETVRRIHLIKGRGKFAKSKGTLLVQGVVAAKKALLADGGSCTGNRHIVVISDGGDNSAHSDMDNWLKIVNPETVAFLQGADVDIHAFGLIEADHRLLVRLSSLTFGNCGVNVRSSDTAIAELRKWIAGVITDAKYRAASLPALRIACRPGVHIAAVSVTSDNKPSRLDASGWRDAASIALPPIPWDFQSSAVITLAVPQYLGHQDVLDLADVHFTYFDPLGKDAVSKVVPLRNACAKFYVDRLVYHFSEQLFLQSFIGKGKIVNAKGDGFRIRGSEMVRAGETICTGSTPDSRATFVALDGTAVEIGPNTTLRVDTIHHDKVGVFVQSGVVRLAAAATSSLEIATEEFTVAAPVGGHVEVSVTDEHGFECFCLIGNATIAARDSDSGEGMQLQVLQFTHGPPFAGELEVPLAITFSQFKPWLSSTSVVGERLRLLVTLQSQKLRLLLVQAIQHLTTLLSREKRKATWPQKNIYRYCRYIVMFYIVQNTKDKIAQSLAYASNDDELDQLRVAFEQVALFTTASYRGKLTLNTLSLCEETVQSIAWERNKGKANVYSTAFQLDLVTSLMSLREKESADLVRLAEEEQRRAREGEKTRRNKLVYQTFQWFDFEGKNVVSVRSILTILATLPRQMPFLHRVSQLLMVDIDAIGVDAFLDSDQFASIWSHALSELSSHRFNMTALMIAKRSAVTLDAIEDSRLSRALFAVYRILDTADHPGYVLFNYLEHTIREAWGASKYTAEKLAVLAEAVMAKRAELDEIPQAFYARASYVGGSFVGSPTASNGSPTAQFVGSPTASNGSPTAQIHANLTPVIAQRNSGPAGLPLADGTPSLLLMRSPTPTNNPTPMHASTNRSATPTVVMADAESETHSADDADLAHAPISLLVFLTAMKATFAATPEPQAHDLIAKLFDYAEVRRRITRVTDTTESLQLRERKARERPQLKQLDLKHCFDGVVPRHVLAVTNPNFAPPSYSNISLNEIAAPICILSGIKPFAMKSHVKYLEQMEASMGVPAGSNSSSFSGSASFGSPQLSTGPSVMDDIRRGVLNRSSSITPSAPGSPQRALGQSTADRESYWSVLQRKLRCDYTGFTQSLTTFPALSVTNRMAQVVSQHMLNPALDPSVMLAVSPVLAGLVGWVRVMLRIVYLHHDFDEIPPPPPELVSKAAAEVNSLEHLLPQRADVLVVQPPKAEQVTATAKKFSRHMAGVFLPPPIAGMSPMTAFYAPVPPQLSVTERIRQARPSTANPATGRSELNAVSMLTTTRPSSAAIVAAVPSIDKLDSNRLLSSTTSRPQSAYVTRASNTIQFGPSKKATSAVEGMRFLNEADHMQQSVMSVRPKSAQSAPRMAASSR